MDQCRQAALSRKTCDPASACRLHRVKIVCPTTVERAHAVHRSLSPRQQEVARLLATGMSSKEAARALTAGADAVVVGTAITGVDLQVSAYLGAMASTAPSR